MENEFDRQVNNLIDKSYHEHLGMSADEFRINLDALKDNLHDVKFSPIDLDKGTLPFVIVISSALLSAEKAMPLVNRDGKVGVAKLYPHKGSDFNPISEIDLPDSFTYLITDIDRGKESINLTPEVAMSMIKSKNRSPLTIAEGIAIVTQFPEFLIKNNCFSLLGSRHQGDQRVPAIWINSQKQPNLGWCWERNPHTWLGSASCLARIGDENLNSANLLGA